MMNEAQTVASHAAVALTIINKFAYFMSAFTSCINNSFQ